MRRIATRAAIGIAAVVCVAAIDTPIHPDDPAYLRRQHAWFSAQSGQRQQQLRQLHADFQQLDEAERARFTKVMVAYNVWLAKLGEADRGRVLEAPTAQQRLEVVRELRDREWIERLPRAYRDTLAKLSPEERPAKLAEWRQEEANHRDEWVLAQQHGKNNPPNRLASEMPRVAGYVKNLKENLSESEARDLNDAWSAYEQFDQYYWFFRELFRLSELHPILPGRIGPKDFASLPESAKKYLTSVDRRFEAEGKWNGPEFRDLRRANGRWPDFGLELNRLCVRNRWKLPEPLGDCTKESMPPEVRQYIDRVLEPALKGKDDAEELKRVSGKWPEYPETLVRLVKKHKLPPIPGWMRPGPMQMWDSFRGPKGKGKG